MPDQLSFLEEAMQALPPSQRWVFADELLWQGVLQGEPVPRGRAGRGALRLTHAAASLGCGLAVVWLVGAFATIALLLRQSRGARLPANGQRSPVCVFVGFGARAEEDLVAEYQAAAPAPVVRVEHTDPAVQRLGRARPGDVWRSFSDAVRDIRTAVANLPAPIRGRTPDFFTTAARRLAPYAFARAWWKDVQRRYLVKEACFLSGDERAFAAVSVGVRAIYLQHGLLHRSLWFPDFSEVYPLTRYERAFLRQRLPRALVHASRSGPAVTETRRTARLLVASGNRSGEEMMLAGSLIRRLSELGVSALVRPFPGEEIERFWGSARLGAPFEVVSASGSFKSLLQQVRPMFVASWGSTALAEALDSGIIPICVAAPDDRYLAETVYPVLRCCLRWPDERRDIELAIASSAAYAATVQRLQDAERGCDVQRSA